MTGRARSSCQGFALLDVLLAMVILSVSALALVALVNETIRTANHHEKIERLYAAADRVLAAATMLHGSELDQRLGTRALGEFSITVTQPERSLYRLSISEVASPGTALLATVVYKP